VAGRAPRVTQRPRCRRGRRRLARVQNAPLSARRTALLVAHEVRDGKSCASTAWKRHSTVSHTIATLEQNKMHAGMHARTDAYSLPSRGTVSHDTRHTKEASRWPYGGECTQGKTHALTHKATSDDTHTLRYCTVAIRHRAHGYCGPQLRLLSICTQHSIRSLPPPIFPPSCCGSSRGWSTPVLAN